MQDVALRASSRHARAVAEVLVKGGVVLLHSRRGRRIAIGHCAIDDVETALSLVQPQFEVGSAGPREVIGPPLDVEDAVGSIATYRREYAKPGVDQFQVVPIRGDVVVVGCPRQTLIKEGRIRGRELGIAIGRQINARESRGIEGVREGQRDGGYLIVAVIADICGARHDIPAYLSYAVMVLRRATRYGITAGESRITIAPLSSDRPGTNASRHAASGIEMHREPGGGVAVDERDGSHAAASIAGQGQIARRD